MVLLRERIARKREDSYFASIGIYSMGELYNRLAEEAGLDPTDEGVIERISGVFESLEPGLSQVDVFDEVVDALIFNDHV